MKEFDVHFILKFSDVMFGIEATNKTDARQQVLNMFTSGQLDALLKERLVINLTDKDVDLDFTDTLEIGKDI